MELKQTAYRADREFDLLIWIEINFWMVIGSTMSGPAAPEYGNQPGMPGGGHTGQGKEKHELCYFKHASLN